MRTYSYTTHLKTNYLNTMEKKLPKGWRIDYINVTSPLADKIKDAEIFPDVKHSDHCPVYLELDLKSL